MTAQELAERQAWPLCQKIDHALFTIETFLTRTEGRAYVAFSGGKDSTVLLDLVRIIDPTVPAVFVNTGNEYPDIIRFVRHLRDDRGYNIEEIHPKAKPREVWSRYGFPLVSKAQAQSVHEYQHARDKEKLLARLRDSREKGGVHTIAQKWEWLLFEDFACSHKCCQILKKNPANDYAESTGRAPIIGTLAAESRQRTFAYLSRGGCNTFGENGGKVSSLPLSIWTDADIWAYIRERGLEVAEIYHKGVDRTGCVGCGFGCQLSGAHFDTLFRLYPKYYDMVMGYTNNGHTFREAARKVMAVNGYELPDERGEIFFED